MDDTTNGRFAIKLLLADFRRNREEVRFMRHEYKVGRGLDHRRVIKIHEYGSDPKNVYLVMELFPAPNLKQIIQNDFESLAPMVRNCILQAGEGLAYLHKQGWMHRDIKPDNYLMRANGDVKLIDFALAKRPKRGWRRLLFRLPPQDSRHAQLYVARADSRPPARRAKRYLQFWLHDVRTAHRKVALHR